MARNLVMVAIAASAAAMPVAAPGSMIPVPGDPVTIASGRVAGTTVAPGVKAYLGIPFAAPPVGALRWAPPQPIKWDGVWNADRKGAECIQVLRPHDINHYFGEEPSSENCLYLNLWAPASAREGAGLPVIVFIYGGGNTIGSSGMANYGGEAVARRGAILVNFNYRVGALGFMAHPELTAEQGGHSGNYAVMDQIAAMQWVRANIAKFGGDPDKVLVMGQSAGAGAVANLMFAPQAKGTFRAAFMSSGCNFGTPGGGGGAPATVAEAERVGLELQRRLGAANLAAMRNIPADRILAQQSESQVGASVEGLRFGGAIVDGYVQPRPKAELVASGDYNKVPIIAGYNGDDNDSGGHPLTKAKTVADYQRIARDLWKADADAFLAAFPVRADADVARVSRQVASMAGHEANARRCAVGQAKNGQPAYLNYFTRRHSYAPGLTLPDQDVATVGAYHTADVPFWLGTLDAYNMFRPTRAWTAADRQLSADMTDALIAMAATGSPSTKAIAWPAWTPAAERRLTIGDRPVAEPLDTRRMDWLAAHPITVQPRRPTGARD